MSLPRSITLAGPSGSGITTISKELESMGYDIIHPTLLETLEQDDELKGPHVYIPKIWDALDQGVPLKDLGGYAQTLCDKIQKCRGNIIIFLYADIPVLTKRQEENRLKTRLSQEYNLPHQQALQIEQQVLTPFSDVAQIKLDTTKMSPILARRTVNLLLSLQIPFEAHSYEQLVDHVVSDFFRFFNDTPVIREILSQQKAARDFINDRGTCEALFDESQIKRSSQKVFLTGEGSSLVALNSAAWLLHKGYGQLINFYCIPASDLRFTNLSDSIVLVCSNSGDTSEIKQNIDEEVFDDAALVIGFTNHTNSALGKYCAVNGVLLPLNVPEEASVAATVSVFKSMLMATAVLARVGDIITGSTCCQKIFEDTNRLPEHLKDLFTQQRINALAAVAKKLNRGLAKTKHGYIISAGLFSNCLLAEASIKAKELSRIHLEPIYHSLFHGPLNPDVETALYLQDPLVSIETMEKHIEKIKLYVPVVATLGVNDYGVPNIPIPSATPIASLAIALVSLQLVFLLIGIESGYSLEEIQYPIRLSKVVMESPTG